MEFCTEQILERQFGTQNLPTIFPITFHIYRGKRQKNNEALNVLDSRDVSTSKKHLPNHILCLQTNLLQTLHFQHVCTPTWKVLGEERFKSTFIVAVKTSESNWVLTVLSLLQKTIANLIVEWLNLWNCKRLDDDDNKPSSDLDEDEKDSVLIELKGAEKADAWKYECATNIKMSRFNFQKLAYLQNWDSNVNDGSVFRILYLSLLKILHPNVKIIFRQGNNRPKSSIDICRLLFWSSTVRRLN